MAPEDTTTKSAGKLGVLGIRREDKNKWERRAPVAPHHVQKLVEQGIRVVVQPSTRRVFSDEEYRAAGAEIKEDLSDCATIAAVKEVPVDLLLPNRTWCFFSHTIKAQAAGMPLLDAALDRNVRLVDYECITSTGERGGPRLVAFGAFAGYAGAIDFLRGLGERFLALGFSTPLLHIGSSFMYPSLDEAKRAVTMAGETIRKYGLPEALCPFTVVFTGRGNVSKGALDIFQLLPHEMADCESLPAVCAGGDGGHVECHKLYFAVATSEHFVRRSDGGPFDKDLYYRQPDKFEPIFQNTILPYSTVIVNGMYWDARFPKLFTHEDLAQHVRAGRDKLLGVCDITCDENGSVPTRQFTSIEKPFFIYNALSDQVSESLNDPGVLFHAVDHLPSELPREASEHFGNCLLPFLPSLVWARAPGPEGAGGEGQAELPVPMQGAIITEGGRLTRQYEYIQQLRNLNKSTEPVDQQGDEGTHGAFHPHGLRAPPACANLEIVGHLFDTRLVNRICDVVEQSRARIQILNINVGSTISDPSSMSFLVMTHADSQLADLVSKILEVAKEKNAAIRRLDGAEAESRFPVAAPVGELGAPAHRRNILVLGAGMVSAPLIEFLLRRRENTLTLASLEPRELDVFSKRYGNRVMSELMDAASATPQDVAQREELVQSSDLVVSLLPAAFHVGIARLAIKHGKHMVTASYVSDEMQSLDDEARSAGVLIINEVGLDPGIDHMSAMRMIRDATADDKGACVVRFSSLCGGLPAPEAAGRNPIGYKFSWSPKGVLLAARNAARYRRDGELFEVPGPELLASSEPFVLNNAFAFDVLPNRDSTSFAELYGLHQAPTFFRGTLRYHGFCERMLALARLGLLQPGPCPELQGVDASCPAHRWLAKLVGSTASDPTSLAKELQGRLGSPTGVEFVKWLGLLGDGALPSGAPCDSPIDVTAQLLQRTETAYQPGERDMVVMYHELDVQRSDGKLQRSTATLVEYGEPAGDTAMARTVGLTAAITAQLVLDDPAPYGVGVQRPLEAKWYEPVLRQLEAEGIALEEHMELMGQADMAVASARL